MSLMCLVAAIIHYDDMLKACFSQPIDYPNVWGAGRMPDVLRLHNVANCTLSSLQLSRDSEADDLKTIEPPALLRWNHASHLVIDNTLQASDGKSFA